MKPYPSGLLVLSLSLSLSRFYRVVTCLAGRFVSRAGAFSVLAGASVQALDSVGIGTLYGRSLALNFPAFSLSLTHSHFPSPSLAESLSFVVSPCAFPLEAPSQQCTSVRQCVCVAYRLSRRTPLTCAVLGLTKGTPVDPSREPFLLRLPWPSSTTRLSTAPCLTRRHLDPFSP